MVKKLGIDLGSSSLGWFLRENDKIIKHGVVTFNTGMVKDQGGYSSPTKNRREARSKRRLIQARKYRKIALLKILIKNDYVPLTKEGLNIWSKYKKGQQRKFPENNEFQKWLACDFTYLENGEKYKNPYELRVKAIDDKLSRHEIGRAFYHIIQRRGYKDIGENNKETKTQEERRVEGGLKRALEEYKYLSKALKNNFLDKGQRARNEYPFRLEYEEELIAICKTQGFDVSKNEKNEYNDDFIKEIRKAIIWQRPLRSQKGNIGRCTLEPAKQRCSVSHPVFEIYRTWAYLNTIKYINENGDKKEIPLKYKEDLFENIFLKKDKNFKFDIIQKYLDKLFKEKKKYNYYNESTKKYDSTISGMPVSKTFIDIFGDKIKEELKNLHNNIGTKANKIINDKYSVHDVWHLIFNTENDYLENFAIEKLDVKNEVNKKGNTFNPIVKLKNEHFSSSYADLSIKAMCKIIPFLKEGFLYNQAVLLAKIPDVFKKQNKNWENEKEKIYKLIEKANIQYNNNKVIVSITNNLIDKYKALPYTEDFAYKNYDYKLDNKDLKDIENACISHFGKITWENITNKEEITKKLTEKYQSFFADEKRRYIELPTLTSLITNIFKENNIEINENNLYHHSNRKNLYPKPINNKKYDKQLLAVPLIDSIKNPMFNKSMSILRKLINELIINGDIDEYYNEEDKSDTEVVVEVARELNDNNKRIAIERYQRERENNREKYKEFIRELNGGNTNSENEDITKFELWAEQIMAEPNDSKKNINKNVEILREKDAVKRYELWMEQKGQCMYTGKMISISQLFSKEIEVEHTIPRSLLPDNTMANLTVCYSKYNSDIKNNKIPTNCPNYKKDEDLHKIGYCSAIEPRLKKWEEIRDRYKKLYEDRRKPFGLENEEQKNRRIQEKHYYKIHYDYWKDKIERFTTEEIKESWVRRQLTDTQMVSKYAREFLKTYFKKVTVQKGNTTADFRKIFGFQAKDEEKNRNKHTHHCIDAAVLTLISTNSSRRVELLTKMYKLEEETGEQYHESPDEFPGFNAQKLIKYIENNTLIVNYQKDKITEQTYRNIRKRGKLQYLKRNGKFVLDEKGNKIPLKAKGTTIRGKLFQETFIGKIKNVEKENNKPLRNPDGSWKYLTGKNEFEHVVRKPITEIVDAKTDDIIDPDIKRIINEQRQKGIAVTKLKDHQGNIIRHVRVKTKAGKIVKDRLNYRSNHDYKNKYYAAAGEIPYAIFITNFKNGRIERKMIPVAIHEIAQVYKDIHKFDCKYYLQKFYPNITKYDDIKLLKVGQKVFVLQNDDEFEKRLDNDFQMKRLYKIIRFSDGNIWLKYHLISIDTPSIDKYIKNKKHEYLLTIETKLNLPAIVEDETITDTKKRKKNFEDKLYKFSSLKDYRLKRIMDIIGELETKKIKEELDKYKVFSSKIEIEGETPLLKTSKNNWNFLFENYDFEINITGKVNWLI